MDSSEAQKPELETNILPKVIEEEMKNAYLTYAMSVIVGRALPDVRDGLKPVHRRVLYAMYDMGVFHNKPFKKCARIVGDCMGKYHPHGDSAIYDTLVRMAQDFSLRYPLIKGQGNFGSIDGDRAAAMRYTEAKLQKFAEELLKDIEKNTVHFKDNFDSSLQEPIILPSVVPNLLVNGSSGIAVGMTTNIPPHNIHEVCDGIIAAIDNPEITVGELMSFVPGPDFPTGGEVICGPALHHAYAKGKGKVVIKSVVEFEDDKIVVKEIPYQVNKEDCIRQIADLVRDKKIEGIRNINDESDKDGIRVVIDLKRGADEQVVLNQLFKYSRLKISFTLTLLALVNNQPKMLGLKDFVHHHIEHRKEIITKRTKYDLEQAQKRVHILEGLLTALRNLDEIIPGIRNSRTVEDARAFLMNNYTLDEEQAKAILDMRLQKLAGLEQEKIKQEHAELLEKIKRYLDILGSEEIVLKLIREELELVKDKYGDARRSKIIIGEDEDFDMEELIEEETVVVTLSNSGYIKRLPLDTYKTQHRGGKGIRASGMKDEDFIEKIYVSSTHDYLLFFTDRGQLYWLKVYNITEGSRQAKGRHVRNLLQMNQDENITAIIPVRDFKEGYLMMATEKGTIKKTPLMEFSRPRKGGIRSLTLDEDDSLVRVRYTTGENEILLATKYGQANRFNEKHVRAMGRTARGVRGIRLAEGDEVIGMLAAEEGMEILTLTQKGYGKRTKVEDYRLCNRGGKGVTNIKIIDKNGPVKAIMLVDGTEDIMLISKFGIGIRLKSSEISTFGRATQGVRVMRLNEGDELAAAAKIMLGDEKDEEGDEEEDDENGEVKEEITNQENNKETSSAPQDNELDNQEIEEKVETGDDEADKKETQDSKESNVPEKDDDEKDESGGIDPFLNDEEEFQNLE